MTTVALVTVLVAAAAAPACARTSTPNLLLIYLDQWRWDWAGFDDPQVRAPNLASIASRGTRFTHAFTPAPLCAPARGCLGAGREYDESPVPDNGMDYPIDGSAPTYYSQLQKAGYYVMMAGKDHLTMSAGVGVNGSIHAKELGFDDWLRTVDKYEVFQDRTSPYDQWTEDIEESNSTLYKATSACYGSMGDGDCCDSLEGLEGGAFCPRTQPPGPSGVVYPDDWTEASAETLLLRKPVGQPWFLQVGFPGPHPPFILTEAMNKSVAGRTYPLPLGSAGAYGEEFYQTMRRQYAGEIENIDALIGKLVEKLGSLGELENTIVAISADHGELLGDYNKYAKNQPWDGSSRVPLLFMGPGVKAGAVSSRPVTTLDIVGTFLELAGADLATNMTTQSMWPLLSTSEGDRVGETRSFISSGLGSDSFVGEVENEAVGASFPPKGGGFNWRMVVKQMNETSTLKLVCCPTSCNSIAGNSSLFSPTGSAQVGLFEITGNRLEVDLLSRGVGKSDASSLVAFMPASVRQKCESAIERFFEMVLV